MCRQGQGVSEGTWRGSSRCARAAAPGRREWKIPSGQLGLLAAAVAQPRSLRGLQDAPSVPEPPCLCLGLLPLESRGVELDVGPWRPGCQPV